jgi:hypothetical protein
MAWGRLGNQLSVRVLNVTQLSYSPNSYTHYNMKKRRDNADRIAAAAQDEDLEAVYNLICVDDLEKHLQGSRRQLKHIAMLVEAYDNFISNHPKHKSFKDDIWRYDGLLGILLCKHLISNTNL